MIYVLLADGFEEIEALSPIDLLRRAGCAVRTVSVMPEKTVMGAHGIPVVADMMPEEASDAPTLLILPGGMPGAKHLNASSVTDAFIERTQKNGGRLAAICAAPLVLGERGLLCGRRAVCYPGFEDHLTGALTVGESETVVTDGNITTAKGMGVAVQFGLELVRLMTDADTAERIRASIFA